MKTYPYESHKVDMRSGWRDNVQSFTAAKVGSSKIPDFLAFVGGVGAYAFSSSLEEEVHMVFHIDHDYELGTAIFPHVHWSPSDATAGVVRWGIEYTVARGHGQEAFPATQTIYMEQATPEVANQHMVAEISHPGVEIPILEPDCLILCRIFRDATHANDTYAADAFAFTADIHYRADKFATPGKKPQFEDI